MTRNAIVSILTSAIVVAAAPAAASAQQEYGRDVTVWTWEGRIDAGHWFSLNNVNGSVTIDPSSDNSVHVRAEKIPHRNGDIRDVRFAVIQSGGDIRICALSRENDRCDEDGLHSDGDRGRRGDRDRNVEVKFKVQVPRGVRVAAGTVNGSMSVRGTRAEVRASTVNGSIDATMSALNRDGDMKFSTVNGTITVETPSSLDANVSIDTMSGGISSDFPVQLSGRFGPRHAEGVIGRGGRRISMNTVNGSVELRKIR